MKAARCTSTRSTRWAAAKRRAATAVRPIKEQLSESSKPEPQFDPNPPRGAGREEGRALQRVTTGFRPVGVGRKGLCEERTLAGQSRVRELRRCVVVVVEQIIDLDGELEPFGQVVMSPEIG